MTITEIFKSELQREAPVTRKILSLVPYNDPTWKPHNKSMPLGVLAGHVAEILGWVQSILETDVLDFSKQKYEAPKLNNAQELVTSFDQHLQTATESLNAFKDETLWAKDWTLRNGETIFRTAAKFDTARFMVFNHIVHHRAQLGVYLRLLDIPLPSSYGPTADNPMSF